MKLRIETTFIDPHLLLNIADGDQERTLKYLRQFTELVPPRMENLQNSIREEDRKMTRQILHQMSPQIQFFGIPDVVEHIKKLELDYKTMPMLELKNMVNKIIGQLNLALNDIQSILKNN